MTNKTMLERLFFDVSPVDTRIEQPGVWYVASTEKGFVTEPVEYVRADLVQGDANEPLADEQYRWIKTERGWEPARVCLFGAFDLGRFEFMTIGEDESITLLEEDVIQIGPVIRPPEDA